MHPGAHWSEHRWSQLRILFPCLALGLASLYPSAILRWFNERFQCFSFSLVDHVQLTILILQCYASVAYQKVCLYCWTVCLGPDLNGILHFHQWKIWCTPLVSSHALWSCPFVLAFLSWCLRLLACLLGVHAAPRALLGMLITQSSLLPCSKLISLYSSKQCWSYDVCYHSITKTN